MNINYRLTEEEARDGLDGILPAVNKGAMRIGGLLAGIAGSMVLYNFVVGLSLKHLFFALASAILAGWFFMNRRLSVNLIGRRAAGQEYQITISRDGFVRTGKDGEKIPFTKDALAADTKLTVSFKPDDKHMYVVPKRSLSAERVTELISLLEQLNCPVKKKGK